VDIWMVGRSIPDARCTGKTRNARRGIQPAGFIPA
jgi:hypothetical protein